MPNSAMHLAAYATLLLGLLLFGALIAWQGAGEVAAVMALAGWGLALVPVVYLAPMVANALAWRQLFGAAGPRFGLLLGTRWIGESVNNLLPVARLGGELAKARLMVVKGEEGTLTGATIVVDLTLAVLTQIGFALLGVALLLLHLGNGEVVRDVLVGTGVMLVLLWGFYRVQRRGLFGGAARALSRVAGRSAWLELVGGAQALDSRIREIYRHPGRLLRGAAWRSIGWVLGTVETWVALHVLGSPVSWMEALMLESLGQAVRGAGFAIPAGLGVQEGGYLFFGSLLGLAPEFALGLSLAKRVRELVLGVPGLLAWQAVEGCELRRRLAARKYGPSLAKD